MGTSRNSLDHSLSLVWGREKRVKVEDGADGPTSRATRDREGRPGQSGDPGHPETSADVHRLFGAQAAHAGDGLNAEGGESYSSEGDGMREGPYRDPEPGPEHPRQPAAGPDAPSRPAWADHPITRALESLYQPGPANPVQIIAESLQPRAFREVPVTDDWFPLKAPPFAPVPDAPVRPEQVPTPRTPEARPGQGPAVDLHADFWQIWSGHQDFLLKQCIRLMAGNMADAEDALSNAMLRASSKFGSYSDSIVNERAWLSRLVHNVCIDHYRRQRRTEYRDPHEDAGGDVVSTMFADAQLTPEEIALEREQVRALDAEISQLSDQLREPLMMRFVEGLSYPEIAERLNLRADTVRKRIQLARDHLKRADIR